jgi:hypothetical protein
MKQGNSDIPIMLDWFYKLFQEYGDELTPLLLLIQIEQKLHRHLPMHVIAPSISHY